MYLCPCSTVLISLQYTPTRDEQWVIRSFLDVEQVLVIDKDFIIQEGPAGKYNYNYGDKLGN